jgi:transposase
LYAFKKEQILELEKLSENQDIDLYYGDESHFSSEGYILYGWQFPDEDVHIPVEKSFKINVLGIVSRDNKSKSLVIEGNINSDVVIDFFENFSLEINRPTCVILDNASVHCSKKVKERIEYWQTRGLYFFYLPPYSPELNIAETLWRKLKKEWIDPVDYTDKDSLFYAVNRCMANIGKDIYIKYSPFSLI